MVRGLRAWAVVAATIVAASSPAYAGEAKAAPAGPVDKAAVAAKYKEGEAAFVARDYARSAAAFMEAFALSPHPNALSNASNAYERGGDLARAATCSVRIAREFPTSELAIGALQRVARFRKSLVELDIEVAPGGTDLTLDGAPLDYDHPFVTAGRHELRATFKSGEGKAVIDNSAGSTARVEIAAPPEAPPPPPPPPPPAPAPAAGPPLHPAFFFVGLGLSVAAGGALTWSGVDTLMIREQFDAELSRSLHETGVSAQTRTNALVGVTAGLGALTLAVGLFLTDWRDIHGENPPWAAARNLRIEIAPEGGSAGWQISF